MMSRVQLALNVNDLDAAIDFYSKLFNSAPTKQRPGYANFAIQEPPLKLVLIENATATERLNHLGIEVESPARVTEISDRSQQAGLTVTPTDRVTCCYALQDKAWIRNPDGADWEIYTVLKDTTNFGASPTVDRVCCA